MNIDCKIHTEAISCKSDAANKCFDYLPDFESVKANAEKFFTAQFIDSEIIDIQIVSEWKDCLENCSNEAQHSEPKANCFISIHLQIRAKRKEGKPYTAKLCYRVNKPEQDFKMNDSKIKIDTI